MLLSSTHVVQLDDGNDSHVTTTTAVALQAACKAVPAVPATLAPLLQHQDLHSALLQLSDSVDPSGPSSQQTGSPPGTAAATVETSAGARVSAFVQSPMLQRYSFASLAGAAAGSNSTASQQQRPAAAASQAAFQPVTEQLETMSVLSALAKLAAAASQRPFSGTRARQGHRQNIAGSGDDSRMEDDASGSTASRPAYSQQVVTVDGCRAAIAAVTAQLLQSYSPVRAFCSCMPRMQ